jgi:group I intron endonuclease
MTGIYKITNIINGKVYVGSAVNINSRWSRHKRDLFFRKHKSPKLQNSYNKYGNENFYYSILEECEKENLIIREQHYIDLYNSCKNGYNCAPKAGSNIGLKLSQETRDKVSKNNAKFWSGKERDKETKDKISKKLTGRKNGSMSEETKNKISLKNSGKNSSSYNPTPIIQYDLNYNLIKIWDDMLSLRNNGWNADRISRVCREKEKTYKKFKWKFKNT